MYHEHMLVISQSNVVNHSIHMKSPEMGKSIDRNTGAWFPSTAMKYVLKLALGMVACFYEYTEKRLLAVSRCSLSYFLRQGILLKLELTGWLAKELQGSFCP